MSRDYIRLRSTSQRERHLARAKEILETDTDSEAIDAALRHLVESVDAYEDVKEDVPPAVARELSTNVVRLTMYPQVRTD